MRRIAVLLTILVVGSVLAAPSPGRQDDFEPGAPVLDAAVARDSAWVAATTEDPRTGLNGLGSFEDVWFYWDGEGALRQTGDAERPGCAPEPEDDCDSNAVAVALDASGARMVVGSIVDDTSDDPTEGLLTFITRNQGAVARHEIPGQVVDLDLSADGRTVAVVSTRTEGIIDPVTHVYLELIDWSASSVNSVSSMWNTTVEENIGSDPIRLDLSSDGYAIVVAADNHHRFNRLGATDFNDTDSSPVASVAVSAAGTHYSIAGLQSGFVRVYHDVNPAQRTYNAKFGETGAGAVDITEDGQYAVAGYANGRLRPFMVKEGGTLGTIEPTVTHRPTTSAVSHLEYSADGEYLVAASGSQVTLYDVEAGRLSLIWSTGVGDTVRAVSITGDGDRIVAAAGSKVAVFDAIHDVSVAPASNELTLAPGAQGTVSLAYSNEGNRPESVALSIDYPAGWFVSPEPATFSVAPNETEAVALTIIPADTAAPGAHAIQLNHTVNGATVEGDVITVSVPEVRDVTFTIALGPSADVVPGGVGSMQLAVTNNGNTNESIQLETTLSDEDWTVQLTPATFDLAAGAERLVDIDLGAPSGAQEGATASVEVRRVDSDLNATFTGVVGAAFGVTLQAVPGVPINPGNESTVSVTLTNTGNAPDSYEFTIGSTLPPGWDASLLNGLGVLSVGPLDAGESRVIDVLVVAPASATVDTTGLLTVRADSRSDTGTQASRTVLMNVVEAEGEIVDPVDTMPTPFGGLLVLAALLLVATVRRR